MFPQTGGKDVFGILEKLESDLNSGYVDAASVDDLDSSIQHFSIQQTRVGAELNKADLQQTALEKRIMLMDENLSNLEDADLASLVTELQSQIVSRMLPSRRSSRSASNHCSTLFADFLLCYACEKGGPRTALFSFLFVQSALSPGEVPECSASTVGLGQHAGCSLRQDLVLRQSAGL